MIIYGYLFAFLYAFIVLLIGALAHKFGLDRKYSRKIIHILIGFEWFILSSTHGTSFHFIIVCLLFLLFLSIVYYKKWLPMMSSSEDNAKGTVFFAVSMTIMASVSFLLPEFLPFFGIAVLATSLGDGLGGVVGQAIHQKTHLYKNKTIAGTLTVFVSTFLSTILFSDFYHLNFEITELLAISFLCAGVELISVKGLDNIFVPLSVSLFSYLLYLNYIDKMMFSVSLVPLLVGLTVGKKKLTLGGALCAVILALLVGLAFGDRGFALLLAFFALALISDEVKKLTNRREKQGECRSIKQVLVISVFSLLSSISYLIFPNKAFLFLFILNLAEALGDTASSGFGSLAVRTFDPFRRKMVEKGESGGMSVVGTLGGLFFSIGFLFLAGILFSLHITLILLMFLCSIFGILLDSILGSLVQLRYLCHKCGKIVETAKHCGENTEQYSGIRPFDNAFVNLVSEAFTVLLFALILFFSGL